VITTSSREDLAATLRKTYKGPTEVLAIAILT
jgi:hypothetical protein